MGQFPSFNLFVTYLQNGTGDAKTCGSSSGVLVQIPVKRGSDAEIALRNQDADLAIAARGGTGGRGICLGAGLEAGWPALGSAGVRLWAGWAGRVGSCLVVGLEQGTERIDVGATAFGRVLCTLRSWCLELGAPLVAHVLGGLQDFAAQLGRDRALTVDRVGDSDGTGTELVGDIAEFDGSQSLVPHRKRSQAPELSLAA